MFVINLPVVATALIGGSFFLEESKDEAAPPPDVPGVLLSIVDLFALVYGIIQAGVDGWGASNVVTILGVAAFLLVVFFVWESRTRNPMLPLYLFRNPPFTGANLAITLMFFGMLGVFFAISQFFQSVQGYTALETGYRLFLPTSIMLMVTAGASAQIAQHLGTKRTVGLGFLISASSMFILSQIMAADVPYLALLPTQIRCIESECEDEVEFVGVRELAPATGD
jgi:MFS family permease